MRKWALIIFLLSSIFLGCAGARDWVMDTVAESIFWKENERMEREEFYQRAEKPFDF